MKNYSIIGNNILDKQGILNLLRTFIFGNTPIEIYDQNKTYNKNDKAYIITNVGNIKFILAKEDGITGEYDSSKWENISFNSIGSIVAISPTEPTDVNTKIWLTPDESHTYNIKVPEVIDPDTPVDIKSMNLLFDPGAIPMVDDTNSADLTYLNPGDIVFDNEGETSSTVEDITDIGSDVNITVDEQSDIVINDIEPDESDPALLWVDTTPEN